MEQYGLTKGRKNGRIGRQEPTDALRTEMDALRVLGRGHRIAVAAAIEGALPMESELGARFGILHCLGPFLALMSRVDLGVDMSMDDYQEPGNGATPPREEMSPQARNARLAKLVNEFGNHLRDADLLAQDDQCVGPSALMYLTYIVGKFQARLMCQLLYRMRQAPLGQSGAAAVVDQMVRAGRDGARQMEVNNETLLRWVGRINKGYAEAVGSTALQEMERIGWSPRVVPAANMPSKNGRRTQ